MYRNMNRVLTVNDTLNDQQLLGFFEGDGNLSFKVTTKVRGRVGFEYYAVFSQHERNIVILQMVRLTLDATNIISVSNSKAMLMIALGGQTPAGRMMLDILNRNPPNNPGTFKDYRIFLLTRECQRGTTLPLTGNLLQDFNLKSLIQKQRAIMLTLLVLRFERAARTVSRINLRTIDDYFIHCGATREEIQEARTYGAELMQPILRDVNELINNLNTNQIQISSDYLAFYHEADGCFKVEVRTERINNRPIIQLVPCWQITDDIASEPLLGRIRRQYGFSYLCRSRTENTIHLRANGWRQLENVVLPFFRTVDLTTRNFTLFRSMERLLELHNDPNLRRNFDLYFEFVETGYMLNVDENNPLGDNSTRTREVFDRDIVPFIRETFDSFQQQKP